MLSRAGVRVTYRPLSFNILLPKLNSGDTSMFVIGWNTATAEAEQALVPILRTPRNAAEGEYNFGHYSNPKVDALLDRGATAFDPERRKALFGQAMDLIDEHHLLFLQVREDRRQVAFELDQWAGGRAEMRAHFVRDNGR